MPTTISPLLQARAEAVTEVASSVCTVLETAMSRHGNDPQGEAVIAGGLFHLLNCMSTQPGLSNVKAILARLLTL